MDIAAIGVLAGTLVALVFPITESLKTQSKNIKEKQWDKVAMFGVGMVVTVGTAFALKYSQLTDFEALKGLNAVDTSILGIYAGLAITGGKDLISNLKTGKEIGKSLKEQFADLTLNEKESVTNDFITELADANVYKQHPDDFGYYEGVDVNNISEFEDAINEEE